MLTKIIDSVHQEQVAGSAGAVVLSLAGAHAVQQVPVDAIPTSPTFRSSSTRNTRDKPLKSWRTRSPIP